MASTLRNGYGYQCVIGARPSVATSQATGQISDGRRSRRVTKPLGPNAIQPMKVSSGTTMCSSRSQIRLAVV